MKPVLLALLLACDDPSMDAIVAPSPLDTADATTAAVPAIGERAIDFTLETVQGAFRLSDHAGDVIVLDLSGFS